MTKKTREKRKEIKLKENKIPKRKDKKVGLGLGAAWSRAWVNRISRKMRLALGRLTGRIRRLTKLSRA